MRGRQHGFTLLELLVAMLIFSLIGLGSHRMLSAVMGTKEVEKAHAAQLAQAQKALWVMTQDLLQMDSQTIAIPYQDYAAGFLRHGWSNPMELPRSDMMQVAFRVEGGVLRRYYWPEGEEASRQAQALLSGVQAFGVRPVSARSVEVSLTLESYGAIRRVVEVPDL